MTLANKAHDVLVQLEHASAVIDLTERIGNVIGQLIDSYDER